MRNWHRWLMTVFGVLLLYWTASGLLMAVYDLTDNTQVWAIEGGGPGARLTDAARTALPLPAPQTFTEGVRTALAASTSLSIASVDLRMVGEIARLQLANAQGERTTMGRFYAATGAPMTALVADGDPDAPQPDNVTLRNTLKMWHRGNIAGIPGQVIGLATGIALLVISVTGVILYVQLLRARQRSGRPGWFWSNRETWWRRLHRWISIVAAALILNLAISGTILAYGELQLRLFLSYQIGAAPYPRPSPLPPVSSAPLTGDIQTMLQTSYAAASAVQPAATITAIQLIHRDGIDKGLITFGGNTPGILAVDAQRGTVVSDWSTSGQQAGNGYFADWHQILKRIHRGDIVGEFGGRYLAIISGLALLYLVISSLMLYLEVWRRRKQMGRSGWFWK